MDSETLKEELKTPWTDFRVKTTASASMTEDYDRHYSRRLMKLQERDFSSKKSSRRVYFTEFFTSLFQLPSESLTEKENDLLAALLAYGRGSLDQDLLAYFWYLSK